MREGRLEGKRALVTTAASGVGRAVALLFAREGARVLAVDADRSALYRVAAVAAEPRSDFEPALRTAWLDPRDLAGLDHLARERGPFDVLVNGPGFVHHGSVLDCDEGAWNHSFELNVTAMFRTIRAVLPGMVEHRRGSIVNLTSVVSSMKGAPNRCAYGAANAAVIGLTKSVAADFVLQGVRCNAVCHGLLPGASLEARIAGPSADVQRPDTAFLSREPEAMTSRSEEIAALVLLLASDQAAYTTGAVHVVDGGWST